MKLIFLVLKYLRVSRYQEDLGVWVSFCLYVLFLKKSETEMQQMLAYKPCFMRYSSMETSLQYIKIVEQALHIWVWASAADRRKLFQHQTEQGSFVSPVK